MSIVGTVYVLIKESRMKFGSITKEVKLLLFVIQAMYELSFSSVKIV